MSWLHATGLALVRVSLGEEIFSGNFDQCMRPMPIQHREEFGEQKLSSCQYCSYRIKSVALELLYQERRYCKNSLLLGYTILLRKQKDMHGVIHLVNGRWHCYTYPSKSIERRLSLLSDVMDIIDINKDHGFL